MTAASCATCAAYAVRRRPVLLRHLGLFVSRHGVAPAVELARILTGVHRRHTSGLEVLP